VSSRYRQRGVALLAAILLVAVGTILAATIAFQSAMAARRGVANLSFEQSALVAQGAEALAARFLKDDSGDTDDFSDVWAQPLPPTEIMPGVWLEASLEDLQSRFNLNSLVDKEGKVDKEALASLRRLLEARELEPKWADQIADWIDFDDQPVSSDGLEDGGTTGQDPPYLTAKALITSTTELLALPGFGRERYLKLAPYVSALPPHTPLNVCTAPALLLDAMLEEGRQEYGGKFDIAKERESKCYPTEDQFEAVLLQDRPNDTGLKKRFGQTSNYFRLTSHVSLGGSEFALYSLLKRDRLGSGQTKIRVVQRSYTPD
jgi:general secretion pathway protein K